MRPDKKQSNADSVVSSASEEASAPRSDPTSQSSDRQLCPTCNEWVDQSMHLCQVKVLDNENSDPLIGKTVGKNYQIVAYRGKGGMSTVYKAKDLIRNCLVAVKFLLGEGKSTKEQMMLRFQREARMVGSLDHPNIIAIHAFDFTADRQPFLVMDYVEGETLAEKIGKGGMIPLESSLDIFIQICNGLAHAHQKGILHRDLKPGNIMLVAGGGGEAAVKILDFGIAKLLDSNESNTQQLTKTGDVFGSPLYMSPEQGLGKPLTTSSDLYSLGCLMFEALTGVPPFLGKSAVETILKHQTETAPDLREVTLGTEFPAQIQNIVATLLAKNPSARFQSAQELGIALSRLKKSILAPDTVHDTALAPRPQRRRNILPAVGIVATTLLMVALLIMTYQGLHKVAGKKISSPDMKTMPTELMLRTLPKLTQQERDDTKVAFDAKYTPDADALDYRGYKLSLAGFAELAKMDRLTSLDLSLSSANDEAMKSLKGMKSLGELKLDMTEVSDQGIKAIQHLPIASCDLGETKISDQVFDYLRNMRKLTSLSLEGTRIDDAGLGGLAQLKELRRLDLSKTPITDHGLTCLADVAKLKQIRLADTQISDQGLPQLAEIRSLDALDLQGTKITDTGLSALTALKKLNSLNLGRTRITNAGLASLPHMPALKNLTLDHTQISDAALPSLLKLSNPSNLHLESCPGISKHGIDRLKAAFPNCEITTVPKPIYRKTPKTALDFFR